MNLAPVWAHGDVEPSTPDQPALTNQQLFFPFISTTDQAIGHGHDDYDLAEQARQRNEPPFVAPEVQPAAATDLIRIGQWGATVTWPFVFASAASLPDGRIVAWGGNNVSSFNGGNYTYSAVWSPVTGQFLTTPNSNHSMFCGIPTTLEDGRVLVNGGDGNNPHASIFDYRTNQWQRIDEMVNGRWYPGSVALPTGQVFTAIGEGGGQYPEIWTPGQGWALQTGANLQGPILNYTGYQTNWLPYFHLAPNGQIFHSGPTPQMNWINLTGNGSVTAAGLTNTWYPKYSTVVMYDEGKLLMAGGAVDTSSTAAGTNQAALIDINGATAQRTAIAPMTYARKFNSNVILPTGEVMIIGGNTSGTEFSDNGTILTPEIWNPETKAWRTVADMGVPRNYHSVALLMPDGRVWSGGGGLCACAADHPNAQIYSPPYLFDAAGGAAIRPAITAAPDIVTYGRTFTVQASAGIQKFSLIKISAVTHDLNSDLRYLRVPFTSVTSGQYQLTMHSNRNVLTPGYWMLFAVDGQGVPSVAKIIQVVTSGAPRITNLGAQSTAVNTAVNLPISAVSVTGNPLTYSATGLPNGLAINSSTGVIAGTVTTVGLFHVAVTVNDGGNNVSNFDWTVYQPGTTRYVKFVALSEVAGNPWASAAEFNVLDSQGNALSRTGWTITADSAEPTGEGGHPAAYAIDGNTSTFWHTPWVATTPVYPHSLTINLGATYTIGGFRYLPRQDASANGTVANYQIFASTDGVNWGQPVAQGTWANNKTEKTVILPVNRAPVVTTPTNQTNLVGNTVTLPISATDPDGDPLTYSATGLPAGLAINSTGVIAGTVNTAGTFGVAVTANDGKGGIATGNFTWTVSQPSFTLNPMFSPPKPVNTTVNYTASVSNGVNPRVKWLFGDGSAETAYATTLTTSHIFTQPGIYVVKLTATDDSGREQSLTFAQAIHLPPTANRPAVSMNIAYEARANANGRIWVVNQDNDTVSVFDAVTNGKLAEIAVGKAPRSLAIAPNGRVWVTNKGAATISLIDPNTLAVVQTVNLPYAAQPFGITFSPTGTAAYVALEASGLLVRFDPNTATQTGSLNVGVNVRQLTVSADGSKLYVSRFITPRVPGEETATPQMANGGAEIVLVDTASLSVRKTIILRSSDKPDTEVQGRGLPNYLGPVVIAPDGVNGWTPSKQDNILRGALRDGNNLNFQNTVRAIASHLDLTNDVEDYATRLDLDNAGVANTALFDKSGSYLFVALETNRQVAVIDAYGRRELFRMDVGRAPQGLALSADGLKLYVNNFMDRTITALDISKVINEGKNIAPTLATYPSVTTEKLAVTVLKGKQFFYDAKDPRLARDSYISCAACHNDG
ncbi:MAG: discoidin domain-containing protein, partial [Chloroflexi bacterium]|nr:discoidin domain-containing protein [Chloroflexota bacterium]